MPIKGHFLLDIPAIPNLKQRVLVEECELKPGCLLLLLWGEAVCQRGRQRDGTLRRRTTYRSPAPAFHLERKTQLQMLRVKSGWD